MVPGPPDDVVVYDALVDPDLAIAVLHLVSPDLRGRGAAPHRAGALEQLDRVRRGQHPEDLPQGRAGTQPRRRDHPGAGRARATSTCSRRWPSCGETTSTSPCSVSSSSAAPRDGSWPGPRCATCWPATLPPEESGADFAPDAERLGMVLAGLHLAMADAWGRGAGRHRARWVGGDGRQPGPGAGLEQRRPLRPASTSTDVRGRFADARRARRSRVRTSASTATSTSPRSSRPTRGWKVLDFEGEPARRRDDRFTRVLAAARRRRAAPLAPLRGRHGPGRVDRRGAPTTSTWPLVAAVGAAQPRGAARRLLQPRRDRRPPAPRRRGARRRR